MAKPPALAPLSEADFEAIEAAVMETNRGRWFLAEYARRNRHADTNVLLTAIDRLEAAMRGERTAESVDRIRFDLVEMAQAIARTKTEIATIRPDAKDHGKFGNATEELDSIVDATESTTSDILAAAERIQEIAWALREQGIDAEVCDVIDAKATEVYAAGTRQDLNGQRTEKVIRVLRYLEGRIKAMIDIWGLHSAMATEAAPAREGAAGRVTAASGRGLDQADIGTAMRPASAAERVRGDLAMIESDATVIDIEPEAPRGSALSQSGSNGAASVVPSSTSRGLTFYRAPAAPEPAPAPSASVPNAAPEPPREANAKPSADDPLAQLNALTPEEKIALFS